MRRYNAKDVKLTFTGSDGKQYPVKGFGDASFDMDVGRDLEKVGREVDRDPAFLDAAYPKADGSKRVPSGEEIRKSILKAQQQLEKAFSDGAGKKYSEHVEDMVDAFKKAWPEVEQYRQAYKPLGQLKVWDPKAFVEVKVDAPPPVREPWLTFERALEILGEYGMRGTFGQLKWKAELVPYVGLRMNQCALRMTLDVLDVEYNRPTQVFIVEAVDLEFMNEGAFRHAVEAMARKMFDHEFNECFVRRGVPVKDPHPEQASFRKITEAFGLPGGPLPVLPK